MLFRSEPDADKGIPEFLAYSACLLADTAKAVAIVSHSLSGASARQISSRRPPQEIFALTPESETVKALNFSWGVTPVHITNPSEEPSHTGRAEHFIATNLAFQPDSRIVITAGQPQKGGRPRGTNLVKIYWK